MNATAHCCSDSELRHQQSAFACGSSEIPAKQSCDVLRVFPLGGHSQLAFWTQAGESHSGVAHDYPLTLVEFY